MGQHTRVRVQEILEKRKHYVNRWKESIVKLYAGQHRQRLIVGSLSIFNCLHVFFRLCAFETQIQKLDDEQRTEKRYDFDYDNVRSLRISKGKLFISIRVINSVSTARESIPAKIGRKEKSANQEKHAKLAPWRALAFFLFRRKE